MSVARLAGRLRAGELSPREAVESYLERIDACRELNAYISVRAERALAEAASPPPGPLHGVPIAVKDVVDVAGERTTAASRILADAKPAARDAAVVERLRAAGAIVLGKLNLHEFAYGPLTTSPHFGPARNPWSPDRSCGGSSGGSGAAAAADLAAGTLGTDTAGSIRIPACLCGVTGVRPSIGLVSNLGVLPVSWTFDTVGPIARSAEDCSLLLEAIAPEYRSGLGEGARGLRVGAVEHLFARADARVAAVVEAALRDLPATVERVDGSAFDHAGIVQQLVMLPEASAFHLPWLRTRLADYGADVRARLLAGLALPATAYPTGLRARRWLEEKVRPLFERYDVLAAPTMPVVAPRIGEEAVELNGRSVPFRQALIAFNSPWSCLGLPVVSVPCGFVDGLPVGLALVGRRFEDATALRAAHAFQVATDWHERRPERDAPGFAVEAPKSYTKDTSPTRE
ncbi:MAG TPA: amidase [Gaiellaceae bacterium]|nr:amidase [Gaiellaceae bacterium]